MGCAGAHRRIAVVSTGAHGRALTSSLRRTRQAKVVATLGPASTDRATIRALFDAGADVFRLNFSHGTHAQHQERYALIRSIEQELGRPIGVLLDLQGPKLRVGSFVGGAAVLQEGARVRLTLASEPGDASCIALPHPEIFAALTAGADLLIDDGKLHLRVLSCQADGAYAVVLTGGRVSDRKGVNVPSVVLPISALTAKDREDLAFGLQLGVDWIALSFVQRAQDLHELRSLAGPNVGLLAKIEKPAAVDALDDIVAAADAVMVARGDLGVELPAQRVPGIQRRIIRQCRAAGKPVIVATQMLESMVNAPVPTRAETSDVATAIFEGADAVMLSAESASGQYPREAVATMDQIITEVESDPQYRAALVQADTPTAVSVADAVCASVRRAAAMLPVSAIVTYTRSGYTSLRTARERPLVPIVGVTPELSTARRITLAWGVHSLVTHDALVDVPAMVAHACALVRLQQFADQGATVLVASGMPFGVAGTTNFLHIATA